MLMSEKTMMAVITLAALILAVTAPIWGQFP